jgi:phosphoglycolate phosphatase
VDFIVLKQFSIDAVMVDLDGTMVDTLGDFVAALNLMLADLPAPFCTQTVTRSLVENLVGKGSENLIKSTLAKVYQAHAAIYSGAYSEPDGAAQELALSLYPQAWQSYQRHYDSINGQFSEVFDGVFAGLDALQARGLPMACLTNKPTAFAKALLKAKGLDAYFAYAFGGDAFTRHKPDPLPLLKTCEALGTTPARTLMIGDSSNDAQAARAAGCPVLLVTYGYNHGQPVTGVDADGFLDSLRSLGELPRNRTT